MIPFIYINPRNNPHYEYSTVIDEINYNFGLISGSTTYGPYLNLSGGTVSGTTTFSGNGVSPMLIIRNPDMSQDYLQLYDSNGDKQLWIDNTNQWAFSAGTNGPLYFGTFSNPNGGLGGFSKPGEVISAFSVNTIRMGVGGGGSYFTTTGPQALLELRGKANERQFIIQASSGQTFNIFEGRNSSENPILIIDKDWLLRGPSMSATSLSAATYYSGTTPLELIINNLITGVTSTITGSQVQPGLNTYTGGTNTAPTVNISGATLNNINVTGNSIFAAITSTTISNGSQIISGEKTNLTGTTVLSGVNVSSFVDTGTTRMVETNSGGTLSATRQIISAFGLPSSAMTALSLTTNWDNNGIYTGTTIDSTYQGQEYYDSAYYYRAMSNNFFIRLIRG